MPISTSEPKTSVGSSLTHTPCKHHLIDKNLGRTTGVASHLKVPLLIIDACAGNGISTPASGTSSPQILSKHYQWAVSRGMNVRALLLEKHLRTFEELKRNITTPGPEILNLDYRSFEVVELISQCSDQTIASLYIDPNSVNDVALPGHLRAVLPYLTTLLVTLGCNANGTKRGPLEKREKWFDHLIDLISTMKTHHDACLVRLEKDASQWAYLITAPKKWCKHIDKDIKNMERLYWAKGVARDWLSHSDDRFIKSAQRLFLKVDGSEL